MKNDDLISRAAAIAEVEQWAEHGHDVIHWTGIKAMLEIQPAVDAVPVVHGRWLGWRHHWAWLVCDKCDEKMLVRKSNHGYIQQFPHNYCPNCGAKMTGDKNE